MKGYMFLLGGALLLVGCTNDERQLEANITETLGKQGNVQQVDLTRQGDGNFSGFAVVREPGGEQIRFSCNAHRGANRMLEWLCSPEMQAQQTAPDRNAPPAAEEAAPAEGGEAPVEGQ